jgi:hypothetical protein
MDKPRRIDYAILDIFKRRLPNRREAILLLFACAFFINIWSIFNLLKVIPSLLLRLRMSQIIYVISYTQTFALLESIIVWLIFILLCIIFPRKILRDRMAAKGTIIVSMTTLWAISFHYLDGITKFLGSSISFLSKLISLTSYEFQVHNISIISFVFLWLFIYLSGLIIGLIRLSKVKQFENRIYNYLERLEVLTWFYLSLDILSFLVVINLNL